MNLWRNIKGTVLPFWVTLRTMFRRPVTIQYPEQKRAPSARFRARIVLTRDPEGGERCVACYLCSAACPVDCISMQAAEDANGPSLCRLVSNQLQPLHLLWVVRRGLPDARHPDDPGL